MKVMNSHLAAAFGNIDIYLFDQLLKGRYDHCRKIIDIGCGGGRNIIYFLQNGFEVFGMDQDANTVAAVKELSQQLAPHNPIKNFVVATVEDMPFAAATFDLAICSAVLHFARDADHFDKMVRSVWRVLKPGGFLFARLASDIGIETLVKGLGNGRYLLPDGSVRFLVNEQILNSYTQELNGELYEPIKTTNVSNLRCMTTWCVRKK
jgi:tellurite methyltransferase